MRVRKHVRSRGSVKSVEDVDRNSERVRHVMSEDVVVHTTGADSS